MTAWTEKSGNIVDRKFYALLGRIDSEGREGVLERMKHTYLSLPEGSREGLERFFSRYAYWGRLNAGEGVFEELELKAECLSSHLDDLAALYELLGDYRSKKTLYAIVSNWCEFDFATLAEAGERMFDEYWDPDLVRCTKDETFVDLGAYVGDSVASYLLVYGAECYKRIYCYEITPSAFGWLSRNLAGFPRVELRRKGVSDRRGRMRLDVNPFDASSNRLGEGEGEEIDVTTLDEDIAEPVTLIKADIEGGEQAALRGATGHIRNDHPKLLVSVYHSNDDLWQIPRMIADISSEYRFFLRSKACALYPTEITLFAV